MKRFLICLLLLGGMLQAHAQQTLSSEAMLGITPSLPSKMNIPEQARQVLLQKLRQIATQNGFGSFSGEFVLTANPILVDKMVSGGVPPQTLVELDISIYLVNIQEGIIVDEIGVSYKGMDKVEAKAFIRAIQNLNPRSPVIRTFMKSCREKITTYYTTRIPALLAKAKSLTERSLYREALATLSVIPETVNEYPAIADQMVTIYLKEIDKEAASILQEVKAALAIKDYEEALDLLVMIDPSSSRFTEASKIIDSIKEQLEAKELAKLEAQQRAYDDKIMLEKMRLEAARKMGNTYAQETDAASVDEKLSNWFLGKFK